MKTRDKELEAFISRLKNWPLMQSDSRPTEKLKKIIWKNIHDEERDFIKEHEFKKLRAGILRKLKYILKLQKSELTEARKNKDFLLVDNLTDSIEDTVRAIRNANKELKLRYIII